MAPIPTKMTGNGLVLKRGIELFLKEIDCYIEARVEGKPNVTILKKMNRRRTLLTSSLTIHLFLDEFADKIKRCQSSKLLLRLKIRHQRSQNTAIYNALMDMDVLDDATSHGILYQTVVSAIKRKNKDDLVPFDDIQFVGSSSSNGKLLATQAMVAFTTICYACGGSYPHSSTDKCPALTHTCSDCSRVDSWIGFA